MSVRTLTFRQSSQVSRNSAVVYGSRYPSNFRRTAVEHLPADVGSIGHVADAASVRSGKFIPAARLTDLYSDGARSDDRVLRRIISLVAISRSISGRS